MRNSNGIANATCAYVATITVLRDMRSANQPTTTRPPIAAISAANDAVLQIWSRAAWFVKPCSSKTNFMRKLTLAMDPIDAALPTSSNQNDDRRVNSANVND